MKVRTVATIFIPLILLSGIVGWLYFGRKPRVPADSPPEQLESSNSVERAPHLARLGSPPDWEEMRAYQGCITKEEFVKQLDETYSIGGGWRRFIEVSDDYAEIQIGPPQQETNFILEFAGSTDQTTPPRPWRNLAEIPLPADPTRPLLGFRIAIDPGHIGGRFAAIEGREFRIDGGRPVREGEMTLRVAKLLRKRLETLGASVFLTRTKNNPVTEFRSKNFKEHAIKDLADSPSNALAQQNRADLFFYRISEIRSRAELLRKKFKPDLTLCLHFNAEAWGDPSTPQLTTHNHFHLLINGAYGAGELAQDDQRFEMLQRLLQRCHEVELSLAIPMARHFAKESQLPAYQYSPGSMTKATTSPLVWKRNLLANRIFPSPVLYFEPYVMNTRDVYERVMAGDYEGIKKINGKLRPSIYREYADSVADGLVIAIEKARDPD